jgi:hypothetical protein
VGDRADTERLGLGGWEYAREIVLSIVKVACLPDVRLLLTLAPLLMETLLVPEAVGMHREQPHKAQVA